MKNLLYILFLSLPIYSLAQDSTHLNVNSKVTIHSDVDLNHLIGIDIQKNELTDEMPGYRIQISSNNDRTEIYNLRTDVYAKFSDIKNYVQYDQPYYRLKIGDFKTRLEARGYLELVIQEFPSAFIVADAIKIR